MKLSDLTNNDREFRQSLITGLRILLDKVPSGSTWLRDQHPFLGSDDTKVLARWINALESFTPSLYQNQLDLQVVTTQANALYKLLKAKK